MQKRRKRKKTNQFHPLPIYQIFIQNFIIIGWRTRDDMPFAYQ